MAIILAIIFITAAAAAVQLFNKALPFRICPICAGVSLTWLGMSLGVISGALALADYQLVIAVLMGGTAVGIGYQAEKRFPEKAGLIFRASLILAGFIFAYWAINNLSLFTLAVESAVLAAVGYLFFVSKDRRFKPGEKGRIEKLEKEMEECC